MRSWKAVPPVSPPHGRIPNFAGAKQAAERLLDHPLFDHIKRIKVLIVTGSVAVTRRGHRCGKGHGYGDLEYTIFRELGYPPVPVATTMHALQVLDELPVNIEVDAGIRAY